jgi:hypothetical protein
MGLALTIIARESYKHFLINKSKTRRIVKNYSKKGKRTYSGRGRQGFRRKRIKK